MINFLERAKKSTCFMKFFMEKLGQYGAMVADAGVITAYEPRKRSENDKSRTKHEEGKLS